MVKFSLGRTKERKKSKEKVEIKEEEIESIDGDEKVEIPIPNTLEDVLKSHDLRDLFRYYLKHHIATEALLFYENIEMFERISSKQYRIRAAKTVLSKFVEDGALYPVNISGKVKSKLLETKLQDFTEHTFDEAKAEIFSLMETNFFAKFVKYLLGTEDLKKLDVNTHDVYRRASRYYARHRPRIRTHGPSPVSTPPLRRQTSANSDSSFITVIRDDSEFEDLENELKEEFDYKLL